MRKKVILGVALLAVALLGAGAMRAEDSHGTRVAFEVNGRVYEGIEGNGLAFAVWRAGASWKIDTRDWWMYSDEGHQYHILHVTLHNTSKKPITVSRDNFTLYAHTGDAFKPTPDMDLWNDQRYREHGYPKMEEHEVLEPGRTVTRLLLFEHPLPFNSTTEQWKLEYRPSPNTQPLVAPAWPTEVEGKA